MSNEECKYIYINEDSEVEEVEERDASDTSIGFYLKVVRHSNGNVTVYDVRDGSKILEI